MNFKTKSVSRSLKMLIYPCEGTDYNIGIIHYPCGMVGYKGTFYVVDAAGDIVDIKDNEDGFSDLKCVNGNFFGESDHEYKLIDLENKCIETSFGKIKKNSLKFKFTRIFLNGHDLPGLQMYNNKMNYIPVEGRHKDPQILWDVHFEEREEFFLARFKPDSNWFPRRDDGKAFANFKKKFFPGLKRENVKWIKEGLMFFKFESSNRKYSQHNGWYIWNFNEDRQEDFFLDVQTVGNTKYYIVTHSDKDSTLKFVDEFLQCQGYDVFHDSTFSTTKNVLTTYKNDEAQYVIKFDKLTNKLIKEEEIINYIELQKQAVEA